MERWSWTGSTSPRSSILGACLLSLAFPMFTAPTKANASDTGEIASKQAEEPFSTAASHWEGYAEFVRLAQEQLGAERVVLTKRVDYSDLKPNDALLFVHPTERLDSASIGAFLVEGGRVGLLDDYGRGGEFLGNFGISVQPAPSTPAEQLKGNPDLAIAIPTVQAIAGTRGGRHPITLNVEKVVTNHPRTFKHPDLTAVVDIVEESGTAHTLMLTGVIAQKGRLLALGDPSVFINFMLRYPGNRHLAAGVLRYLMESAAPDDGAPTAGRLFILTNGFAQSGRFGPAEKLSDKLNRSLEDAWETLQDLHEGGLSKALLLMMAAVTMIWIFAAYAQKSMRLPQFVRPSYSFAPAVAGQVGAASRLDVLASTHASPVLALLELDGALRDSISRRLKADGGLDPKRLSALAREKGLGTSDSALLGAVLQEFQNYARLLSQGKRTKIRPADMRRLHSYTLRLLKAIETTNPQ